MVETKSTKTYAAVAEGAVTPSEERRPWEDQSLSAKERYDSYFSVVRQHALSIHAAGTRKGITEEERTALRTDPDKERWVSELRQLLGEKPDDFCYRINLGSIRAILGKHYIGPEAYKEIFGASDLGTAPAIPASVTSALLNERCKLTDDGRTVAQTHRLVFVPSKLDGQDVTVNLIRKIATDVRESCGRDTMFYDQTWHDSESFANTPHAQCKWILMPTVDIPNTRDKNYDAQEKELRRFPDYHTATALEMVVGLIMKDLHVKPDRSRAGAYYDNFGWCSDALLMDRSGRRVCVGHFSESGLYLDNYSGGDNFRRLGRAGLRNI